MDKKIKSLTEKIYKKTRDEIITSSLKPGERLIEKKLCEKYKVSRTPLREALMQLQAQGYPCYYDLSLSWLFTFNFLGEGFSLC